MISSIDFSLRLRLPSVHELSEGDYLAEVVCGVASEAKEHVRHRDAGGNLPLQTLGLLSPPHVFIYPLEELRDERAPLGLSRGRRFRVDVPLLPLLVERLVAVDHEGVPTVRVPKL